MDLGGLAVWVLSGDAVSKGFEAAHLGLEPTSALVPGQPLPRRVRPKCQVVRRFSFLAWAAGLSSFQGLPFLRIGMIAVPPRLAMAAWQVRVS